MTVGNSKDELAGFALEPVDSAGFVPESDESVQPPDEADSSERTALQHGIRLVVEWLIITVAALALALLLKTFVVQVFYIPSGSMTPTLQIGDRILVYKVGYSLHDMNRGDVVVFSKPDPSYEIDELIKRVVAVGGDMFELRDGNVYINGSLLDEPYLRSDTPTLPKRPIPGCDNDATPKSCKVPEDMILVLGDNREESRDGRFFGPVHVDTVVGRAVVKIWPLGSVGLL